MTHLWEGIVWLFHTMGTTYADFFSMNTIHDITSDPLGNLWNVLLLVIMEGLLSADNAIVLAVMVSVLPKHLQKKALFYGMAGAILFRLFAVGIGTTLVKLEIVTVLGGAYLLYLAIKHFLPNRDDGDAVEPAKKNWFSSIANSFNVKILATFGLFWATVIQVEFMDIAFSVDSVLAAFGVSNKAWVIFLGGVMGVFMMRSVAKLFVKLLENVKELEVTAYLLIGVIGLKMMLTIFGIHINQIIFFSVIVALFGGTFVVHHFNKKKTVN